MRVLGIETSCDETSVAIYDQNFGLLTNQVYSQNIHSKYGGVVPELAARDHIRTIIPVILSAFQQTNSSIKHIHGIAYTAGPGLIGSLLVGSTVASTLAYVRKIPIIDVHHMEAHILAPMLGQASVTSILFKVPFVALLVSGGHTQLVLVKKIGSYKILGESVDDAVGEVFDKIAMLLGLKYPGGSLLSEMAQNGIKDRYIFPKPMINKPGLNFSFSGLKTAVARTIMLNSHDQQDRADIARGFEDTIVDILMIKCRRALQQTGIKYLVVSGGVSANRVLRLALTRMMNVIQGKIFFPKLEFCTDNGAMIAYIGLIRLKSGLGLCNNNLSISVKPRWSLESLSKI